jgi:hypothetical protein
MEGYADAAMGASSVVWRRLVACSRFFDATNLTAWIGGKLKLLEGHPYLFVLIILTAAILFMTEIMSNTAVANMVIPMTIVLRRASGRAVRADGGSCACFIMRLYAPDLHPAECGRFQLQSADDEGYGQGGLLAQYRRCRLDRDQAHISGFRPSSCNVREKALTSFLASSALK